MKMRIALQCTEFAGAVALALAALSLLACATAPERSAQGVERFDQGEKWGKSEWEDFYSRDQGSRLIPYPWIVALKQANGESLMADNLERYGYLPNDRSVPSGLPVGFVVVGNDIGMTCSACHTRQIEVDGKPYRVDGGPAIVDFESFLTELDVAVNKVLTDPQAFKQFAEEVLGSSSSGKEAKLREDVKAWFKPYHTIIEKSVTRKQIWGPARLDAVTMIFNRITGLDIGLEADGYMIPGNIKPADAPVRYPFLWNASIQDMTQWPGFAENGNRVLGLSRNLGEVIGVFALFHPHKDDGRILGIDYTDGLSANFGGLNRLEDLIRKLGPPKWPKTWPLDQTLAVKGEKLYKENCAKGCHEIKDGAVRSFTHKTWATPLQDVGTDSREYDILSREVDTGVLAGARIPFLDRPLKPHDKAFSVLSMSVTGAILQHYLPIEFDPKTRGKFGKIETLLNSYSGNLKLKEISLSDLKGAFKQPAPPADAKPFKYEARVLEGIWAAAPYLHNGSVPTLAELLKPAAERIDSFEIGPAYDVVNIGLAAEQNRFVNDVLKTTDCSDRNSGNSRCGHEFGTQLSAGDKKALLEYLKTL